MSSIAQYTIKNTAGALIEARVQQLKTAEDAEVYSDAIGLVGRRVAATGLAPILCADHRPVRIYGAEVADRLVQKFQQLNTVLDRIAIIVTPTNAVLLMQLERIVREARYTKRRVFKEPVGALDHLAEALNPAELARAKAFLEEIGDR